MSNTINPDITDLIDTGRRKLQDAAEAQQQRELEHAAERQSAIDALAKEAWEALGALLPDSLLYYAGRCSDIEPTGWNDVIYRLDVPGCSAITVTLKREQIGFTAGQYLYAYKPSDNFKNGVERGVYCVSHYGLVENEDGYLAGENGHHTYTSDLSVALAIAAGQGAKLAALTAEAQTKTDELQARALRRQATREQQQQTADDRRLALISKVLNDDLAVRLIELFHAIQTERENWTQTVQDAAEHADSLAERYEHRLAQQQRDADRAIRSTKDDVERAQREADDLQAQLARIKRQAQYA